MLVILERDDDILRLPFLSTFIVQSHILLLYLKKLYLLLLFKYNIFFIKRNCKVKVR